MNLPHKPEMPLLGIDPREIKTCVYKEVHANVIASLFINTMKVDDSKYL
jgi:hypothetical protein